MPDDGAMFANPHARPRSRARWHLLLSVTALLLVAAGCFVSATRIMDGLYAYASPLNQHPVPTGEPVSGTPSQGRLVLVMVDGLRVDTATDEKVMPTLARLREQGAFRVLHSHAPSYSAPGWAVLGTGAWPDLNGGEAMNPEGTDPLRWQQDNIFAASGDAGLRAAITGNDWWRSMLPPQTWAQSYFTLGEDTAADAVVVSHAVEWLEQDQVDLLMVDLNGVDHTGHDQGGPDGTSWPVAAHAADAQIAEIADALDLSRDTLLVVSDHGHIGPGGHGGTEPEVVTEPLLLVGGPIKPGPYPDAEQVDVAPTIATILGTRLPAVSQGQPLTDMLTEVPTGLTSALTAQQQELARSHARALGRPDDYRAPADDPVAATRAEMASTTAAAMLPGRWWRGLLAAVVLVAAGFVLWRQRGRLLAAYVLGALAFLAGFHLCYSLVFAKPYSLSWIEGTGALIGTVAAATLVGLACGLTVSLLAARPWQRRPADAALCVFGATAVILLIAGLPAVVSLVFNGIASPYTLPEMHTTWFGFTAMLQGLVVTLTGLLVAAVMATVAAVSGRRKGSPAPPQIASRREAVPGV